MKCLTRTTKRTGCHLKATITTATRLRFNCRATTVRLSCNTWESRYIWS